jgi:hypothetical protein
MYGCTPNDDVTGEEDGTSEEESPTPTAAAMT